MMSWVMARVPLCLGERARFRLMQLARLDRTLSSFRYQDRYPPYKNVPPISAPATRVLSRLTCMGDITW